MLESTFCPVIYRLQKYTSGLARDDLQFPPRLSWEIKYSRLLAVYCLILLLLLIAIYSWNTRQPSQLFTFASIHVDWCCTSNLAWLTSFKLNHYKSMLVFWAQVGLYKRKQHTSLGSLLVHDSVATILTTNRFSRLQLILCATIYTTKWVHLKRGQ